MMNTAEQIFERLAEVLNVKTDAALAAELGMSRQSYSNAKKRGAIPYERIHEVADREEISLDYLLRGHHPGAPFTEPQSIEHEIFEEGLRALDDSGIQRPASCFEYARYGAHIYNMVIGEEDEAYRKKLIMGVIELLRLSEGKPLKPAETVEDILKTRRMSRADK